MNSKVVKDVKSIVGFMSSIALSIIAVALAMNNFSYWFFFIIVSLVVLAFSVARVDRLYKEEKTNS